VNCEVTDANVCELIDYLRELGCVLLMLLLLMLVMMM